MSHYQHLIEQLKQLRLGGLVDSLELRLQEAEKQQLSLPRLSESADSG